MILRHSCYINLCLQINIKFLLLISLFSNYANAQISEVEVTLKAPKWVSRGGEATFTCIHSIPSDLLYKVEFLRSGAKILQYVKERSPPYSNYTIPGGRLNMSRTTENSITIESLDFAATGQYWCEVSLETPIYTAASQPKFLTIVHPQKHPPIITFGEPDVIVGGMLRANCTSAPASPAPHLTWYIDDKEVSELSVKRYSYRVLSSYRSAGRHHKYKQRNLFTSEVNRVLYHINITTTTIQPIANLTKATQKCRLNDKVSEEVIVSPPKPKYAPMPAQLTVSISELHVVANGKLKLTCVSTVPGQVEDGQEFADVKRQTVTVAVNELSSKKSITDAEKAASSGAITTNKPISFNFIISNGLYFIVLLWSIATY